MLVAVVPVSIVTLRTATLHYIPQRSNAPDITVLLRRMRKAVVSLNLHPKEQMN